MNTIIIEQYIDDTGKLRMVKYSDGCCIFISPNAPYNVPICTNVIWSTYNYVILNFDIIYQQVFNNKVIGLYINPFDKEYTTTYKYIPIYPHIDIIEDIPCKYKLPPYIGNVTKYTSELNKYEYIYKISSFLQQCITILYFYYNITTDACIVKENYVYDMFKLPSIITLDGYPFENRKLIVPTEKIYDKLIDYLKTYISNKEIKYTNKIMCLYENISDYKKNKDEIICIDSSLSLKYMKYKTNKHVVKFDVDLCSKNPYIYNNIDICDDIFIIQNVENGIYDRAVSISYIWRENKINKGYFSHILNKHLLEVLNVNVYSVLGIDSTYEGKNRADVIEYDNGDYAAILFM